jgi:hypothetical protein
MVSSDKASRGRRGKTPRTSLKDLSIARRILLELMQYVGSGHIECLQMRDHEPVIYPLPTLVREFRLEVGISQRPWVDSEDLASNRQIVNLFAYFDQLKDCEIRVLEIAGGLPVRMDVHS